MAPILVFLPGKFMGRGAWQATVYGVKESQTDWETERTHARTHAHTHTEQSTASNGMESIPEVCELVLISIFTAEGTL